MTTQNNKGKKTSILFIFMLLLSSFLILNNGINNVNATEQTGLIFNSVENPQHSFVYSDNYTAVASDKFVFVYDNLGVLTKSFNVGANVTTATQFTFGNTKIIEYNSTNILIVANERYYNGGGSMSYYIWVFNFNVFTGVYSTTTANAPVTGYWTGNYGVDKLMLMQLGNGYIYALVSTKGDINGGTTETHFFRVSPTVAYIGANTPANNGAGYTKYYVGYGGFYIPDVNSANKAYIITRNSLTTFAVYSVTPETPASTSATYTWTEDSTSGADKSYYSYLVNSNYGMFYTGNYTVCFTTTLTNATYTNLLVFHFITFDGAGKNNKIVQYIDFSGADTPIRVISAYPLSGSEESFTGITSLVCVDGNGNYRHLDVSLYNIGYQILNGVLNYNIVPIQCTYEITGTTCSWTYINYPVHEYTTSSSIGGYQKFGNNLMFMIDYLNGKLDVQLGALSIEGIATNIYVESLNKDFDCYLTTTTDYYVAFMQPSKDILGRFESKYFQNSMWFGSERVNSTTGWYNVEISPISTTPYTYEYSQTLLGLPASITENINPAYDGNFSFAYQAQEPTQGNYYYQMLAITGTYEITVDGENAYISKTAFVYVIVSKATIETYPSGLPTEYSALDTGELPNAPTPTPTPTGTTMLISVELWIVLLIYTVFCVVLGLIAGKIGLLVGLVIATIICLVGLLIPLWSLAIVVIALVIILLEKMGIFGSSQSNSNGNRD